MAVPPVELRTLIDALRQAKCEIELARVQSTKPENLRVRTRRAAVKAARAVVAAADSGIREVWLGSWWVLDALRNPDNPDRPPAEVRHGDRPPMKQYTIHYGSGCNPDGSLRDDTALEVWTMEICPYLRSKQTLGNGDAGSYDFPRIKTSEGGEILGRDGAPLEQVATVDGGWTLSGPAARETDDYDRDDAIEHLRCQADDWADMCGVAIAILGKQQADDSTAADSERDFERLAEIVGDSTSAEIVRIASGGGSVDQRMRDIIETDSRFAGKSSDDWASLLSCTASAVRLTATWKLLQSRKNTLD